MSTDDPSHSLGLEGSALSGNGVTGNGGRSTLLELLPSDMIWSSKTSPTPTWRRSAASWKEAADHLEVARRLGEEVSTR